MKKFKFSLKKLGLQAKLISAFILMGSIVFVVGWIGQTGSFQLAGYLNEISEVRLPSIIGLQMMEQGLNVLRSGELALLNPRLSEGTKQDQINQIEQARQNIQAGYQKYEPLPRTTNEDKLWKSFRSKWERWGQEEQEFFRLYQKFQNISIPNPQATQLKLLKQAQENSPQMAKAVQASMLLEQMNIQFFTINRPAFNSAQKQLQKVIKENEAIAAAAKTAADQSISTTQFWVLLGMFGGSLIAIVLGIILSLAITKPLDKAIRSIINTLVSSSSQIVTTVEEQERIASNQAAAVNQTTTTMDQLRESARVAAEQAKIAVQDANQALALSETGNQAVGQTLEDVTSLKEKVEDIGQKIRLLSEQTHQIGSISLLVSELANQTNMLALNAAVEAVRASEQGQGFGVIATEIRRLADESKQSANKINQLVVNIQTAINATVIVMDEGTNRMEKTVKIAHQTANAFSGVAAGINNIVACNLQIALTTKQQALAIQQVLDAMNGINVGAKETATGITQTKVTTQNLNEAAFKLKLLV